MTEKSEEELARLDLIRRRMAPARPGRGPRLAAGILIAVLLVVGALWTFAPAQVRSLFGFGTSRPQDMQQPAAFAGGISTEVPRGESVDTAQLSTELPVAPPKAEGLTPEDQLRLDQMEARAESFDLGGSRDLSQEFATLEAEGRVDQELAELKARLGRG